MTIGPLAKGLLTFVPGVGRLLPRKGTGGTISAEYCYGVWLKHLTMLWSNGLLRAIPGTLAELGPGDSLGTGLAAMLSGVNRYYALDVVEYSNVETNLRIFDELVDLFRSRAPRPTRGWPDFDEHLDGKLFPSHILTDAQLQRSLDPRRVAAIRASVRDPAAGVEGIKVAYMVPWFDRSVVEPESVDVVLSHSVLEHVADIEATYRALHSWLEPGGVMTHQIDFESHGVTASWNGYRRYSELHWSMILGKRPFLINRQPHSAHVEAMCKAGFRVVCDLTRHRTDGIRRSELSSRWRRLSDSDLTCSGAFVQAVVP